MPLDQAEVLEEQADATNLSPQEQQYAASLASSRLMDARLTEENFVSGGISNIISYLGMKSWDLQACDRASMITHIDRDKKNSAYNSSKIFHFLFV